ncbi:hypothetical protein [Streptomyces sp. col6]|uniref:hypothetical protein n=1 Tax=Streptomyces sp. col6 TaxID=2478958 RepID=UPI001CD112AC|nr:hypothetical protein [Streptomyces sp. col6]
MEYPPYPNDSQAGPPLLPRSMPRWAVVLIAVTGSAVVLLPILAVVGFFSASGAMHENLRFAYEDVTVSSCRLDAKTRRPVAGVRVTSRAARSGSYTVYLAFRDRAAGGGKGAYAGKGVAAGKRTVVVKDLAVGATASERVVGPVAVWGRPVCEVADVTFLSTALASASATP